MYNLTKFARVYGAQSGNMCKVDHQALSYSKVLSETHLYLSGLHARRQNAWSQNGGNMRVIANGINR